LVPFRSHFEEIYWKSWGFLLFYSKRNHIPVLVTGLDGSTDLDDPQNVEEHENIMLWGSLNINEHITLQLIITNIHYVQLTLQLLRFFRWEVSHVHCVWFSVHLSALGTALRPIKKGSHLASCTPSSAAALAAAGMENVGCRLW
jgi:hypothetical protein